MRVSGIYKAGRWLERYLDNKKKAVDMPPITKVPIDELLFVNKEGTLKRPRVDLTQPNLQTHVGKYNMLGWAAVCFNTKINPTWSVEDPEEPDYSEASSAAYHRALELTHQGR